MAKTRATRPWSKENTDHTILTRKYCAIKNAIKI